MSSASNPPSGSTAAFAQLLQLQQQQQQQSAVLQHAFSQQQATTSQPSPFGPLGNTPASVLAAVQQQQQQQQRQIQQAAAAAAAAQLQHAQQLQLKYQANATAVQGSSPSVTSANPSISLSTTTNSVAMQSYLNAMQSAPFAAASVAAAVANGGLALPSLQSLPQPHQQQIMGLQVSRRSSSPHHHARIAAATARQQQQQQQQDKEKDASPATGSVTQQPVQQGSLSTLSQSEVVPPRISASIQQSNSNTNSSWAALDIGGMSIKNVSHQLFSYTFLTALYLNHNSLIYLPSELSRLSLLVHLDVSGNQLKQLPPEMGQLTNLKTLLAYDNVLQTLPFEFGTLYQLEMLGLEGNPIVEPLQSLYQKHGVSSVISFLRDNGPAPPPPPDREWITVDSDPNAENFTVLSYNILCDKYATSQVYAYTPSWALSWEFRKEKILQEILFYGADIVCLQEVESSQFEEYFKEQLRQHGDYDGFFYPKSRARTMTEWDRKFVDGCAIFFRASKFTLEERHLLEFNQLCVARPDFRKTEDMYNRVMTRDNVAVVSRLVSKDSGQHLHVANVHIHWDPLHKDVKLIQTALLVEELERLTQRNAATRRHAPLALLVCGDFNSMPSSGVYEYLSRGQLEANHEDFAGRQYVPYSTEGAQHRLQLQSAYASAGSEPPFTNYTPTFSGVIDYIWYTSPTLAVTGVLAPVSESYMSKMVGLPNAHFPSDHVALLAEVKVRPQALPNSSK